MSPRRPNTKSVDAITKEKALAGQTLDDSGMWSAVINVGIITLNPDTKYSVMICDIMIEKMKATSDHMVGNDAGRSLPSRSMRTCRDSSEPTSRVGSLFASVSLVMFGLFVWGWFEAVRSRMDLRWNTCLSSRPSVADALDVTRNIDFPDQSGPRVICLPNRLEDRKSVV